MERLAEILALLADEEQRNALTSDEVTALQTELRALYAETRQGDEDGNLTADHIEALSHITDALDEVEKVEVVLAEQAAEMQAKLAELDAKVADPEPELEVAETPAAPEPDEDDGEDGKPAVVKVDEPELVTAATKPVSLGRLSASIPARTRPRANPSQGERLRAMADGRLPIDVAGSELSSVHDISEAILETGKSFVGKHTGAARKIKVAEIETDHYLADRMLDSSMSSRQVAERINAVNAPEAITAAGGVCGPATPRYDQMVLSTAARPVRDALMRFGADRGAITYVPPIDIFDIGVTGGAGVQAIDIITNDEDIANTVKPSQVIVCGSPVTCTVDAITNILTFGNLLQRTGMEQMDAYVQYAEAAHARVAETNLLTLIGAGSSAVSAGTTAVELGAFRESFRKIIHIAANQRYAFRMATTAPIRVLLPSWFGWAMVQDYIGASHTEGVVAETVNLDTIAGWFSNYGINVTWTLDGVTGQTIPAQPVGQLVPFPGTAPGQVTYYVFPEGSWLFLDGGTLDLGVVRDSTLNSLNRFQLFSETFERACLVGPWSLVVTQGFCTSGASGGQVDPEDLCITGS